jgi:hypothetical protein
VQFKENQYLGHNTFGIVVRKILALFFFIGYYWSQNPLPVVTDIGNVHIGSYPVKDIPQSGEFFFIAGIITLTISMLLVFIKHYSIEYNTKLNCIELSKGYINKKIVRIAVEDILRYEIVQSKNFFSIPTFNLVKQEKCRVSHRYIAPQ